MSRALDGDAMVACSLLKIVKGRRCLCESDDTHAPQGASPWTPLPSMSSTRYGVAAVTM